MSSFQVQKSCKDSNERKKKRLEDVEFSSTEKMWGLERERLLQ
jgi:hypothetical protein